MNRIRAKWLWLHGLFLTLLVLMGATGYNAYQASRGRDCLILRLWLHNNRYTKIHVGMTKQQVKAILGPPSKMSSNPFAKTWAYADTCGKAQATKEVPDVVTWVRFTPDGRVKDVMPRKPSERVKATRNIIPGMTEQQIKKLAGKPVHVREHHLVESWTYPHWNRTEHSVTFDKAGRVGVVSVSYRRLQHGYEHIAVCEMHK